MQKAEANKRTLTENFMTKLKPQSQKYIVWDTKQRGLAVLVQPTGFKSWKAIYSLNGRPRWLHLGACDAFGLKEARKLVAKYMGEISQGRDPAAEKKVLHRLHADAEVMPTGCCGMAGSFGFETAKYDVSVRIAEHALLPRLRQAAPDTVVLANGFSCREQIEQGTGRATLHLAELIADAAQLRLAG